VKEDRIRAHRRRQRRRLDELARRAALDADEAPVRQVLACRARAHPARQRAVARVQPALVVQVARLRKTVAHQVDPADRAAAAAAPAVDAA